MSGGSYDYLYRKFADDLFGNPGELERMVNRLTGLPWASDVAADAADLLAIVKFQTARVDQSMKRLKDVFHAVEWWDSCDYGEDQVRDAVAKYRGEQP